MLTRYVVRAARDFGLCTSRSLNVIVGKLRCIAQSMRIPCQQGRLTDTIRCVSVERDVILGRWVHVPAITVFSCDIFLMFRCSWCMYVIVLDD